jgi:POT family proton-dependent oligopeptide transporter
MAYLFHTIGELCISPVALSFITEIISSKICLINDGSLFCAATGLGNKVAGIIGSLLVI